MRVAGRATTRPAVNFQTVPVPNQRTVEKTWADTAGGALRPHPAHTSAGSFGQFIKSGQRHPCAPVPVSPIGFERKSNPREYRRNGGRYGLADEWGLTGEVHARIFAPVVTSPGWFGTTAPYQDSSHRPPAPRPGFFIGRRQLAGGGTYPVKPRAMKTTRFSAASLLLGLVIACGGCATAGTSTPFKVGAASAGPFLQRVTDEYIGRDAGISADEKANRYAKTSALKTATANRDAITVDGVEAAWAPVRPFFYGYTDADATLDRRRSNTAPAYSDRQIIQDIGHRLDSLIDSERGRIARWVTVSGGGATAPAVSVPSPTPPVP